MTGRIQGAPAKTQLAKTAAAPTPEKLGQLATEAQTLDQKRLGAVSELAKAKEALKAAPDAKKPALQRQVDAAQASLDKAHDAWGKADSALSAAVSALKGRGHAKAKLNNLVAAYESSIAARDKQKPGSDAWKKLDAGANVLLPDIHAKEDDALMRAKWKGETNAESNMDGLEDLASRTREEQIRIVGAPVVGISSEKAADFDRKKVSLALKGAHKEFGTQMMADQLEGADEAAQLKLLQRLSDPKRDHLSAMIAHAGEPNGANTQMFADAIRNAKGGARQLLIDKLAASIKGPDHPMVRRLGFTPTFNENFQVSASLVTALKKAGKTDAANALMGATATELRALRGDFEKQKKVVDALNAEFSRTVTGFAGAVDPKAVENYRDSFVSRHKEAFAKYEQTAGRYMDVFKAASSGAFGELELNPLSDAGKLRIELRAASATHGEALLNTQSGQKALDDAMKLQLLKQPSWLDNVSTNASSAKTYIELPQKMAEISARAIVRVGVGMGKDAVQLNQLISKNAKLLGITEEAATKFNKMLASVSGGSEAERLAAYKRAANDLGGGDFGKATATLGLLLAGPSLINGWINIKDQNALGALSHSIDTLGFANDALRLFSDSKVLGAASKALGGAGAAVGLVKGVMALSEGKLLEGGTNLAAAAGGALMLVPGGQLFGAALVIGATIANLIWADDPAEQAELAQQKNVREFLEMADIRPEIAAELSDVLQSNHRSVGPFVEQMAEHLGMKSSDFLKFLNHQTPGDVRKLVRMVKDMPADKGWNFTKTRVAGNDYGDTKQVYSPRRDDMIETRVGSPKSLETAKVWMRENGLLPPGAK